MDNITYPKEARPNRENPFRVSNPEKIRTSRNIYSKVKNYSLPLDAAAATYEKKLKCSKFQINQSIPSNKDSSRNFLIAALQEVKYFEIFC